MIDIEFFVNPKMEKETVYMGRHNLRFKMNTVRAFDLKDGDRIKVGIDKTENPMKHVYLVKTEDRNDTGFKVIIRKNSCMIAFKGLYDKLQIQKPQNCRYEIIDFQDKKWIKVLLPTII